MSDIKEEMLKKVEKTAFKLCNDSDNNSGKGCYRGDCLHCGRYEIFKKDISKIFDRLIAEKNGTCEWKQDRTILSEYSIECGGYHTFDDGNVYNNNYKYCPYCGKKIKETRRVG